jgi:hypothetical protein
MSLVKVLLKELGLVSAFVVLGSLLLVSAWLSTSVQSSFFGEFKQDLVSVILEPKKIEAFESLMQSTPEALRYEIQSAEENRQQLSVLYPELSSILDVVDSQLFPVSATIVSENGQQLVSKLQGRSELIRAQLIHQPPTSLRNFLGLMTATFGFLWIFTLVLFLYFQLERLAFQQTQKWSLMKMLGAEANKVFFPILGAQLIRIFAASLLAIVFAYFMSTGILEIFSWEWSALSLGHASLFLAISLLVGVVLLYSLFLIRYRQVSLG